MDSIAEFKVLRSNYLAEHGRSSAGTVTVVTRNGTNAFHGDVYEFFRNDMLNANNYFNKNNLNGTPRSAATLIKRPPMRWNDFGFTLGGPIKKDKTFFFYSQEWRRITYPVSIGPTGILPAAAEMNGVFPTDVCVAFNPDGTCAQTGPTITNIDPTAAAYVKDIFSKLPAPNNNTWSHTLTTASGDYRAAQNTYNIKGDYGNSDFDRRHVFTATYVYTLPFYKSQEGFTGHVLGGWELSGLVYLNSGLHYSPSISSCSYGPAGLGLCGPTYSGARRQLTAPCSAPSATPMSRARCSLH